MAVTIRRSTLLCSVERKNAGVAGLQDSTPTCLHANSRPGLKQWHPVNASTVIIVTTTPLLGHSETSSAIRFAGRLSRQEYRFESVRFFSFDPTLYHGLGDIRELSRCLIGKGVPARHVGAFIALGTISKFKLPLAWRVNEQPTASSDGSSH